MSMVYSRTISWSRKPSALYYLMLLSFAEASFFPIPPDVLLAPMCLAHPKNALRYAAIATLFSGIGGIAGYAIGVFGIHLVLPYIHQLGYIDTYQAVMNWFKVWGFWAVIIAGFTPIPYKIFTIAAGAFGLPLIPFFIASIIGRSMRFFLVAGGIMLFGEKMDQWLRRYIDIIGWSCVFIIAIVWVLR